MARVQSGRLVLQGRGALAFGASFHRAGLLVEFGQAASVLPIVALSERHPAVSHGQSAAGQRSPLADVRADAAELPPSGAERA